MPPGGDDWLRIVHAMGAAAALNQAQHSGIYTYQTISAVPLIDIAIAKGLIAGE